MLKQSDTKLNLANVLRSARSLRQQLDDGAAEVALTISGGGGGTHPDVGPTAIACVFDITSKTRDDANAHLNDLASQGCECSGPTATDDGQFTVSCNCPD